MFKGINRVFIVGNLGSDPEIRYTVTGSAVVSISVATSDTKKDRVTGDFKSKTEWHKIVLYNKLGEIAYEHLKKGFRVWIEGSLRKNTWQAKDGFLRSVTEIIATDMHILDVRVQNAGISKFNDNDYSDENDVNNDTDNIFIEDKDKDKGKDKNQDKYMFFDENIPF